jgi:hypothetical protein
METSSSMSSHRRWWLVLVMVMRRVAVHGSLPLPFALERFETLLVLFHRRQILSKPQRQPHQDLCTDNK